MRSDRSLLVVALSLVPPLRARGLRACVGLIALGFLALCGHPRCALAARPSNADAAFTQVSLVSPSGGTGYVTGVGHPTWPTFLDSTLVRAIGGTDSILIASTRNSGVRIGLNGSVTYTFPPRTFANRVGTIVTADDWTDPLESTLPMLIASFTFADGRTWGTGTLYDVSSNLGYPYLLYYRVRNWSDQVVPGDPGFVTKPLNPAVFQLCAQASNGGVGNVYSDLQTFFIPDTLRNTALQTVTFASHTTAFDSTHITSAHGLVTGCAVWPQFRINNRLGDTLAVLRQDNSAWADSAYGGYAYNDTLIGQHRTIGELGCLLTCLSMVNTFLGVPTTPDSLNACLQRRPDASGFTWRAVTQISSVVGSTVTFDIVDTTSTIGPTFLIEDGRLAPRATVAVTGIDPGGQSGSGTITQRFNGGSVSVGDFGVVYDDVNYAAASFDFSGGVWNVVGFHQKVTAALVESTLARNSPVMLYTAIDAAGAQHWVVADGRQPAFVNGPQALGTYSIKDPAYLDGGLPLRRLLQPPHNNMFQDALACSLLAGGGHFVARWRANSQEDAADFVLRLQGEGALDVRDPSGNAVVLDDDSGAYVSGIPGVIALRHHRIVDPFDKAIRTGTSDVVQLPRASSGLYVVTVAGTADAAFILSADATRGTGAASRVISRNTMVGGARRYLLEYSPGVVSVVGVTGVRLNESAGPGLAMDARPNPTSGGLDLEFILPRAADVELAVLDIQGRRVASLVKGVRPAGHGSVRWDGRGGDGSRVAAGVYLARLTADGGTTVKRVVVLK
jgi:hypothetical protein